MNFRRAKRGEKRAEWYEFLGARNAPRRKYEAKSNGAKYIWDVNSVVILVVATEFDIDILKIPGILGISKFLDVVMEYRYCKCAIL